MLDGMVLCITLAFIVIYGALKTKGGKTTQSYIKGDNESKWWTIGLSVMATQASAITFMSTPGQAFHDGMGFVQFYFGMPLAMIIICVTFIPIYHRLKVYTAYEYLETRFDLKTRILTAFLFLIQRGLAAGITIYAPSIILSTILGWDLKTLNVIIGSMVILYTISGGTKAVSVTQKQQMFIIMAGMFFAFYTIIHLFPAQVGFSQAMHIAGQSNKLNILDFSFNPESRYTVWSGLTGGLFLALSYFGTDQSQVQRYLSGKSIKESQMGLVFNGLLKVPMQFFILLVGVMVFVFFQFNKAPLFFNTATWDKAMNTEYASQLKSLEEKFDNVYNERINLLSSPDEIENIIKIKSLNEEEKSIRSETKLVLSKALPSAETNDKDYVFIHFILNYLPHGLIGLLLAVIFSAAMSSSSSELSSLGATTAIDVYKRLINPNASEQQYVNATKWFTLLWGAIAVSFACYGTLFENLIQLVNIIGSIFYGVILGIFLAGFYLKQIQANAIFYAAIIVEFVVILIYCFVDIGYLWLNAIGCIGVILVALFLTFTQSTEISK